MANHSLSLAALVLAGGQSSRMGQDKALLCWDGTSMLQRVCRAASPCCDRVYILTPWQERYQASIDNTVLNLHWLAETNPGQGSIVGLLQGMTEIEADWILLLACDLPLLDPAILQIWINQLDRLTNQTLALVPRQSHGWEPLCAFYRKTALPELQNFIQQGGRSFQIWLSQILVQPIHPIDRQSQMLWNCNTPQDFWAAQASDKNITT